MKHQTRTMLNLVLGLVLLLFPSCFVWLSQACHQLDQQSLLSIMSSFQTSSLNWSSSTDCCHWEGITCDANGHVTHLWLPSKGLTGTISPAIGNLTHLSHLNLSHNRLVGPLPVSFFPSLRQLKVIDLSYNRLLGEFPSSLSSNHIEVVNLSSNNFDGTIPSAFFQLAANLESFNVSNNSYTGLIPSFAWIDFLCPVRILDFSYNDFSGEVPPGLGNCSKLKTFRAGFNNLSGSLPDGLYAATSLQELSLPVNHLSGPIDDAIVKLKSLTTLELYSNQLMGVLPRDIGKLTALRDLLLHVNYLSGSLPPTICNCSNLSTLNLRVNFFDGDLTAFNFSMLHQLRTLDLGNNNFTGSLPSTLYSCKLLTAVRLSSNQLEGQISPDIIALESLSFLSLSKNKFTNITVAIASLMGLKNLGILILSKNFKDEAMPDDDQITISYGFENIQLLALGGCQLNGQVPAWLAKLRNLQVLDLSLNKIRGPIPGWLWTLPSLMYMDLSYNFVSGGLGKEVSGLQALVSEEARDQTNKSKLLLPISVMPINTSDRQYITLFNLAPTINLSNNRLSGSIPAEIGQLKFLHALDLSHNNLRGNIPNEMSQLTNLENLDLSCNHLSGEIPVSLKGLHFLASFSVAYNNLRGQIPTGGQFDTFSPSSFEGNPALKGDATVRGSRSIESNPPLSNGPAKPSVSSNNDFHYGLTSGAIFGFIIGITSGILYPLRKLKFPRHSKYNKRR